ncbi:MAG: hypothetical protein LBP23_01640, partial [Treponema sp.]|nr:hypothetical protein [Treponema sp.]
MEKTVHVCILDGTQYRVSVHDEAQTAPVSVLPGRTINLQAVFAAQRLFQEGFNRETQEPQNSMQWALPIARPRYRRGVSRLLGLRALGPSRAPFKARATGPKRAPAVKLQGNSLRELPVPGIGCRSFPAIGTQAPIARPAPHSKHAPQ